MKLLIRPVSKFLLIWLILASVFSMPTFVLAQEINESTTETQENTEEPKLIDPILNAKLQAVIKAPATVGIDKAMVVDGSQSTNPNPGQALTYQWDFGDGNQKEGKEVVHFYKDPGQYVITLQVSNGRETSIITKKVFAARKSMLFITDKKENENRINGLINFSEENGVYVELVEDFESVSEFISEEVIAKKLLQSTEQIRKTDQIIIWSEGNTGLNSLFRIQQQLKEEEIDYTTKSIMVVQDQLSSGAQFQRIFQTLKPEKIVVAKESAIYPYIESANSSNFLDRLAKGGYEYVVIDESTGQLRFLNFMSYFVNFLIERGIPDNTIVLILLLPVIATVIAFMKQVIGISTLGVYTPTILTLTFWMLGLKFGVITFIILLTIGTLTRYILKKFRILYIPKMAIVLTIVALTLFAILTISVALDLFDAKFFSFTIFPLLIMSTLTEKFVSIQTEKGYYSAIIIMAKTIVISIVALFFIGGEIDLYLFQFKWEFFRNLLLGYPETIFVILIINIFLGKWTGLRLLEYVRFREVFRHIEEE